MKAAWKHHKVTILLAILCIVLFITGLILASQVGMVSLAALIPAALIALYLVASSKR